MNRNREHGNGAEYIIDIFCHTHVWSFENEMESSEFLVRNVQYSLCNNQHGISQLVQSKALDATIEKFQAARPALYSTAGNFSTWLYLGRMIIVGAVVR